MKMLHVTIQTEKFEAEVQFYLNIVGLKMITDVARQIDSGDYGGLFTA